MSVSHIPLLVYLHMLSVGAFLISMQGILSENDPHSTTKLINMHEAHKALVTKWPPFWYLPSRHLPLRGLALSMLSSTVTTSYQALEHLSEDFLIKVPMAVLMQADSSSCFTPYNRYPSCDGYFMI